MSMTVAEIRERWSHLGPGDNTDDMVSIRGTVEWVKDRNNLQFVRLRGEEAQTNYLQAETIQLIVTLSTLGERHYPAWRSKVLVGSFVEVHGAVGRSTTGVLSILVDEFAVWKRPKLSVLSESSG